MIVSPAGLSQGAVVGLAAVPFLCVVLLLAVRHRRRRADRAILLDDRDYELVFPDGPEDRAPARRTVAGRQITRR
ncbi:MAG: hypothetical protein JWN53_586 [Gemmatimonadetes bacterium]|jgi:hypothetical protein|nr:hypothetical protein [Gemmatimonadota bacterium]